MDAIVRVDDPPGWRLFRDPLRVIETHTPGRVAAVLDEAEGAARDRALYAVGFVAYEAGAAFGLTGHPATPGLPLARFALYDPAAVRHIDAAPAGGPWTIGALAPSLDRAAFGAALDRIHRAIAEGDTYQVNFTFRLRAAFDGDPLGLFADLAAAQQGGYAAFLRAGRHTVCSASPELFFELVGRDVTARPMKGTARRGRTGEEDRAASAALAASAKERAENVMIVDMVRNDLGRVADVGSVEVPALFTLERYPTLWQMTSTVTARAGAPLSRLFEAAFPSASVTGAPKVRTMALIRDLEPGPRGVYTGAIGVIDPGGRARFNVAIRTAVVDHETGLVDFGVGSGVVWDSVPEREYEECLLKGAVLGRRPRAFDLLETLRWSPADGYVLLARHLARMAASADYFGRPFDESRARDALARAAAGAASPLRVRLLVAPAGGVRVDTSPLDPPPDAPATLAIAESPIDPSDTFLFHKTTAREVYDRLRRPGADDTVLWNPAGEATETTVANLVVALGGRKVTPPVSAGLLAGTFRAELLARGEIVEAPVPLEALRGASGVWLINSVRGWRRAAVVDIVPGKR